MTAAVERIVVQVTSQDKKAIVQKRGKVQNPPGPSLRIEINGAILEKYPVG